MRKMSAAAAVLLLAAALLCSSCSGSPAGSGTLTSVAGDDLKDVFEEIARQPGGGFLPTAVTAAQIEAGDAAGWQYLWEEDVTPRMSLKVYVDGEYKETVTELPGASGISGAALFAASVSDSGYVWATDLENGGSHRYTYETDAPEQPRRLAAGTMALNPDEEIWLAALLYGTDDSYKPTDLSGLQEDGLEGVPLAAVLTATFTANAKEA